MIDDALLDGVSAKLKADGVEEEVVRALRADWPGVHFTYCMDDDVGVGFVAEREEADFNLYLVTGKDHCVSFTRDRDNATGVVVAYVEPE